jgi:hypothetical protein
MESIMTQRDPRKKMRFQWRLPGYDLGTLMKCPVRTRAQGVVVAGGEKTSGYHNSLILLGYLLLQNNCPTVFIGKNILLLSFFLYR